jgi:hypothetical protein
VLLIRLDVCGRATHQAHQTGISGSVRSFEDLGRHAQQLRRYLGAVELGGEPGRGLVTSLGDLVQNTANDVSDLAAGAP